MKPKPKPKKPKHANAGNKNAQRGPARRVPVFVRLDPADLATLKHQAATRGLSQSDTVKLSLIVLESSPMKTLKLKTSENSAGLATLQNPAAPVGLSASGSITYEVKGIPEHLTTAAVAKLFNETATVSGHTFEFAQLGAGLIARGT